jgi:hypothetical protein
MRPGSIDCNIDRAEREAAAKAIQAENTNDGSRVSVKTMDGQGVVEQVPCRKIIGKWRKT